MVFLLRQLQGKCREQNKGVYMEFIDLKKSFDTVSRRGNVADHGAILDCPTNVLSMIIQLARKSEWPG